MKNSLTVDSKSSDNRRQKPNYVSCLFHGTFVTLVLAVAECSIKIFYNCHWEVGEYSIRVEVLIELESTVNILIEIPCQELIFITDSPQVYL